MKIKTLLPLLIIVAAILLFSLLSVAGSHAPSICAPDAARDINAADSVTP